MVGPYLIRYPRRRPVRAVLRWMTGRLIHHFGHLDVQGIENVPKSGPVILAANHFNFVDPPLILYTSPRMVEFIGGAERPNSPPWAQMIPKMWGFIRAYRGGFSRSTLKHSLGVLEQGGVLGIFPEGGSWATLLRPARPGLAFLALHSGAQVVPVSIAGAENLLGGKKQPVKVIFHPPVAAPQIAETGIGRRQALDAYGSKIMSMIAMGLPDSQRGLYSNDPEARAAAEAVSDYPFHLPELRGM
ncbi:MAG: lysophospholipid acyltransferase family protein [Hyphomonas sp.]